MMDYRKYYNLEEGFFDEICEQFKIKKQLTAVEFFMIVSWKSNRPKPSIAKALLLHYKTDSIEKAVKEFSSQIYYLKEAALLQHLVAINGIGLAMASAILSVLYPEQFTIYDYRVCHILNKHQSLGDKAYGITPEDSKKAVNLWNGYLEFVNDVQNYVKEDFSLRDKDRYLWGKSFIDQLENDVKNNFN